MLNIRHPPFAKIIIQKSRQLRVTTRLYLYLTGSWNIAKVGLNHQSINQSNDFGSQVPNLGLAQTSGRVLIMQWYY
jgi:hypothetical protein